MTRQNETMEIGVLWDAARQYRKRDMPLKELASYTKVIGDPVRMQILALLKDEEVYVQELTEKMGLSFTTLSHHMTKLMMAGLVTSGAPGHLCVLPNQHGVPPLAHCANQ